MNPVRNLLLAGSRNAWLQRQATNRRFVKLAVRRFMPGETLVEALAAAAEQNRLGIAVTLTHLGENTHERAEADAVLEHYVETLGRMRDAGVRGEVSVKPTQLGLDIDAELCRQHMRTLAEAARVHGSRLWIDMESSEYTDPTLALFRDLRSTHANVGVCLQAYLRRTRVDLESVLPLGPAIRVVKGAYAEPSSKAFPDKRDVDDNYVWTVERLWSREARARGARVTLGTHDRALIAELELMAKRMDVDAKDYEYALLFGIQRGEQQRLVKAGRNVRVLISYGAHWFPWYMRRLAERPANLLFVAKSMFAS